MSRNSLQMELTLAVVFKLVALFLLYVFFFGPSHRTQVTPADMAAVLGEDRATEAGRK
jgi:hypothetical protein